MMMRMHDVDPTPTGGWSDAAQVEWYTNRIGKLEARKAGERMFAERHGLAFHVMGRGFTWESDDISRDKEAARAACPFWPSVAASRC